MRVAGMPNRSPAVHRDSRGVRNSSGESRRVNRGHLVHYVFFSFLLSVDSRDSPLRSVAFTPYQADIEDKETRDELVVVSEDGEGETDQRDPSKISELNETQQRQNLRFTLNNITPVYITSCTR